MTTLAVTVQDLSFNAKDLGYIVSLIVIVASAVVKIEVDKVKMKNQIFTISESLIRTDQMFEKRDILINSRIDNIKKENSESHKEMQESLNELRKEIKDDFKQMTELINRKYKP